jgi:hypothetical protein
LIVPPVLSTRILSEFLIKLSRCAIEMTVVSRKLASMTRSSSLAGRGGPLRS